MALNTVSSDRLSTNVKNTNFTAAEKQDLTDDILPLAGQIGNRNLIINGEMRISQRNGTSNTTIASGATYGLDRFSARSQTGSGHTMAQSTDAPAGFLNSVKITIGTGAAPSAGNRNYFYQTVEGNNIAHLGAGTANAKTVTFSFFVKSSLTGNFGAAITNGGGDYSFTFPYTINSANTWEKKTKTITLTSSGTWPTNTDGGLTVFFDLGSGSDYEGTPNQWNNALDIRSSSDVKLVATSSATLFITGVQLEVGSVATDFEHRSFAVEKRLCMRYYQQEVNPQRGGGRAGGTANKGELHPFFFPVEMRSTPTVSATNTGGSGGQYVYDDDGYANFSSLDSSSANPISCHINYTLTADLTNGSQLMLGGATNTSYETTYKFDAEL